MENLFISESSIGYHYNNAIKKNLKADFLSFTFYPKINNIEINNIFDIEIKYNYPVVYNFKNISNHIDISFSKDIISYILSLKKKYIFISYDLDKMGELMAGILNYSLIANGFNAENIFRVPLCSFGYDFTEIGFSEFLSKDLILKKLKDIQKEELLIKKTGYGFKKNFILKEILLLREKEFKKLNNKTNTLTYVTKYLINEKK